VLLANHELDPGPGLDRRLQLTRGLHWLFAAQGDSFASLLRGYDLDPAAADEARAPGPVWQSRTGAWVVAHHHAALAALAHPDLVVALPGQLLGDCRTNEVRTACERAVASLPGKFDVVELAWEASVSALGGDPADHVWRAAAPALDAALCPQSPPTTRRMLAALAELTDRGVPASAAPIAATLAADAIASQLTGDRWAHFAPGKEKAVVTETLRDEPPVHLLPMTAAKAISLAGADIDAGAAVVVLLGAANRDRRGSGDGDGDVDWPLVPGGRLSSVYAFARDVAESLLAALARRHPRLRADGPAVRSRRAPVTRPLSRCPVVSA